MNTIRKHAITPFICMALVVAAGATLGTRSAQKSGPKDRHDTMAVAFPWAFENGTPTSRKTAITTAEEIARKAGFASVPSEDARSAWKSSNYPPRSFGHLPSLDPLWKRLASRCMHRR